MIHLQPPQQVPRGRSSLLRRVMAKSSNGKSHKPQPQQELQQAGSDHFAPSATESRISRALPPNSSQRSVGSRRSASPAPSTSSSFKNMKYIDENQSVSAGGTSCATGLEGAAGGESCGRSMSLCNPFAKLIRYVRDARLHQHEKQQEDELNRSEHDGMMQPWANRSFKSIRYIDEKDECWRSHHVDLIYGESSDDHYGHSSRYLNTRSYHGPYGRNYRAGQRQHESMLDVLRRLRDEEDIGANDVDAPLGGREGSSRRLEYSRSSSYRTPQEKVQVPAIKRSMLEVMENLSQEKLRIVSSKRACDFRPAPHKTAQPLPPALVHRGWNAKSA